MFSGAAAGLRGQFSRFSGIGSGDAFPDPFLDMASLSIPTSHRSALYWAEHVFNSFGTYRMAMERIIAFFLTDVAILNSSDEEKEKWEDFLNNTIDILSTTQRLLRDRQCFHGDTVAVTRNGVFKLRDLAGKTVDVLSEGGVYRPAEFKSFGRQSLLEVEFNDGRTVLATPEHQWVAKNASGKLVRVPTTSLTKDYRIERTVAPRPAQDNQYYEGVRHGFVFGDGTRSGEQTTAQFCGDKDAAMIKYFEGHGGEPKPQKNGSVRIYGLPSHYKLLPSNSETAEYWYGFVCGFLAADGTVDTYGCALLTQKAESTLEAVAKQLPRIGMAAGPIRSQIRNVDLTEWSGPDAIYLDHEIHFVTLLKQLMMPQDFLLPKHRENFERNYTPTKYGQFIGIRGVHETGIVDETFCCVEPETHTFVVGNGVLTSNCYGNGFASVVVPFKRFLSCPKCGYTGPLSQIFNNKAFAFEFSCPDFHATCPACKVGSGYRGPWRIDDKPDDEKKRVKVKLWSPHEIELLHDQYTEDVDYLWRIPEDYKQKVKAGKLWHLERVPKEVLKAIHHNQMYRFHRDMIFHMKEPTVSGIVNRGWGLSRLLVNFRQVWYVQVLRRFNEAIALDYVIPFRIITPAPASGKTMGGMAIDPMQMYNGTDFRAQMQQMIRRRRRDPASIQVLGFPVQFQMFGADANKLAPRDLLDQGMETLLNDVGTPVELYNGSLQLQTAPVALRLFESTWHHLVHDSNAFIGWLVNQISQIMSWETVDAELKRTTIVDDIEKQMMLAQLAMSQQVSGSTLMDLLGQNWKKEQKQLAEEARFSAELQARTQEEMQQAGFAASMAKGQPAQGGDPSQQGGGQPAQGDGSQAGAGAAMGTSMQGPVTAYLASMSPNVPQTPQDMLQVADSLSMELMGLPESIKDSELRKLAQSNEVLHSLVKSRMEAKRRQTRQQAGTQAVGQQQQSMQGGGQPPMAA